jgi:NAD(P)-dependent dehydrogenase (short-subunit alcohol dehydrogenase family)
MVMVLREFDLDGKVAIVTGGGTGLGKAMALALAEAGADIVITARRPAPIEETAREVRELGRRASTVTADVTDSRQVNQMVQTVISEFGKIDILVNNAGVGDQSVRKTIWDITDDEWHIGINANLTGTFFCCRAVSKHMVERKRGKIINIASAVGIRGMRNDYMYGCAKAGVAQLTRILALSLGEGIQVNSIAPGFFVLPKHEESLGKEHLQNRTRNIPIGRFAKVEELGPLAVFLASDASNYITGEVFVIDGGGLAGGYAPTGYAPRISMGDLD